MTNSELFKMGKIVELYNYVDPNDLDADYIGHLIVYDNKVYEVITDEKQVPLNPNGSPTLMSESLEDMYTAFRELQERPVDVKIHDYEE